MANGIFAPELVAEGWFDETLRPEGWFSQDFLAPETGDVTIEPEKPFFGGGSYSGVFKRPRKREIIDDDDDDTPEAVEIIKIGDAPKRQIITGIVAPIRKARAKEAETLKKISRQQVQSERARAEQIRRIIQADDEWLMTA